MHLAVYIKKQALREDPRVLALRKRLEEASFELVHAHAPFLAGLTARHIAKKRNIPLVATFHSKYYDDVYKGTHSKALASLLHPSQKPSFVPLATMSQYSGALRIFGGKKKATSSAVQPMKIGTLAPETLAAPSTVGQSKKPSS